MTNDKVYIVLKNADFTEGRGPMLFHSVWSNYQEAEKFVLDQHGIYGTQQKLDSKPREKQDGVVEWDYNGYTILEVYIRASYDKTVKKAIEVEIEGLTAQLREAQNRLSKML